MPIYFSAPRAPKVAKNSEKDALPEFKAFKVSLSPIKRAYGLPLKQWLRLK